ncbi:MAG: hypothetical protein JO127_03800 [Caulobacteraceae bacterium]|nr:hypothetical protein [Caulobacteraceae bacterium]
MWNDPSTQLATYRIALAYAIAMRDLQRRQRDLSGQGLVAFTTAARPFSPNTVISALMLIVGVGVLVGIIVRVGPFG